jgi:hypothetical protein
LRGFVKPAPKAFSISVSIASISEPESPLLNRSSKLILMAKRSSGNEVSLGNR